MMSKQLNSKNKKNSLCNNPIKSTFQKIKSRNSIVYIFLLMPTVIQEQEIKARDIGEKRNVYKGGGGGGGGQGK